MALIRRIAEYPGCLAPPLSRWNRINRPTICANSPAISRVYYNAHKFIVEDAVLRNEHHARTGDSASHRTD